MDTTRAYPSLGSMDMPKDFPYRSIYDKGRPEHRKYDDFWRRHPTMEVSHRAKIFSPFDALRGFDEGIHKKEVAYYNKLVLGEDERAELDRRLSILHACTRTARLARENRVTVSVRYFVPCADEDGFSSGVKGSYETVTGIVRKVDAAQSGTLRISDAVIALSDIVEIRSESGIFDVDPEQEVS